MVADSKENRVLVLAPTGRDAQLLCTTLQQADIAAEVCPNAAAVSTELQNGAAALLLAQEALQQHSVDLLADAVRRQPSWSDLPILVLTAGGEEAGRMRRNTGVLQPLGNVTLLERPAGRTTLISVVRTALRARSRQYEIRDHLMERARTAEELARGNDDLRQFALVAAHDLQEPSRTISVFAQLLASRYNGKLDTDADEFLHHIVHGVQRVSVLLEDLLSFAQLTTRPTVLTASSAEAVLEMALFNLTAKIRESGAIITHDRLPQVMADQMQIVQVFQNLISNAIKYRGDETPRIHISAEPEGGDWIFAVRDNGMGFKQEYAERIFGLFKRLHGRDVPGTGIGLANCRRIIDRHSGRIWAVSEEGKGSTFYFTLSGAAERQAGTSEDSSTSVAAAAGEPCAAPQ